METIEVLNKRLKDNFGIDTVLNVPMYRIVWANDQIEKRRVTHTDAGIELVFPHVLEVKKYPFFKDCYILERLVIIPEENQAELPASKVSYEPIWTYRDNKEQPVPPVWIPTKFIIDTLHAALGKKSLRKYTESELHTTPEGREERITQIQAELFGNENDTTDALAYHEGVSVPPNYEKVEK